LQQQKTQILMLTSYKNISLLRKKITKFDTKAEPYNARTFLAYGILSAFNAESARHCLRTRLL